MGSSLNRRAALIGAVTSSVAIAVPVAKSLASQAPEDADMTAMREILGNLPTREREVLLHYGRVLASADLEDWAKFHAYSLRQAISLMTGLRDCRVTVAGMAQPGKAAALASYGVPGYMDGLQKLA